MFQQVCRWNAAALHLVPMIEFCQAEQKLVVNAGEFWLFCFYGWRKCLIEQFFFCSLSMLILLGAWNNSLLQ